MCNSQHQCKWLERVISSVLAVGVLCLCVSVLPAMAQQQSDQGTQGSTLQTNSGTNANKSVSLKKIQVVGTRIPRSTIELARPVILMNAKQIQATGLVNVGQILQHLTSAGSSITSQVDVGGNGGTELDLRNLGSKRVLILVNGRRWLTGLGGSVNLDQIPTSVIESIQVLKDGASAIYGSDAIAGVVNIITKKTFIGAQASAYLGEYNSEGNKWDGQTQHYSYLMGFGNSKGNVTVALQYQQNDEIKNCARWITCPVNVGTPRGSSFGPNGRFEFYPPAGSSIYSNTTLCPPNKSGKPYCDMTTISGTDGTSISDYKPWSAADEFNYGALYDLVAPNQSTNLYVQGHYALNPDLSFHMTAMYNRHVNTERYSPRNVGINAGGLGTLISATNPYNPFGFDLNANLSAPEPGAAQLILAGVRILKGGFRNFVATNQTFYYNSGFDGDFNLGRRNFTWNADYVFGRELEWDYSSGGLYNNDHLDLALGPVSACQASPGCVPMNIFGSGGITPAMLDYITTASQSTTTNILRDYEFNVASSDIADLPGGPVGFNVGYEYRQVEGAQHPDTLDVATGQASKGVSGGYVVKSFYAEFDVPLLENVPLVKEMDVDLAARHSKVSTYGSNTTKQLGFRWQPNDQLLVRATWGQGFRTPNISELFSPQGLGEETVNDPCNADKLASEGSQVTTNCAAAGVPVGVYTQPITNELDNVTHGGNPNLEPEHSESRTVGFVFNPSALPGFNVNADFYKVSVSNLISVFGASNILNACYIGGASQFCKLVQRNAAGQIIYLGDIETNVGDILTEGIDVGASYAFDTSAGAFKINFQSTFLKEYEQTLPSGTGGPPFVQHRAGWNVGTEYVGYPKNKSILSVAWNFGNWAALWRLRYISSMIEDCSGFTSYPGACSDPNRDHLIYSGEGGMVATNHLGATTYDDASVSYAFHAINSNLTFGVNNLFDKYPPISRTAPNENFNQTVYDLPGRFVYLRLTVNF